MNPAVIIPTYVSTARRRNEVKGIISNYDHTTDLHEEGELDRCLKSLENVNDMGLIMVLVVSDRSIEEDATKKIREIVGRHPTLNVIVIGNAELAIVRERMDQLGIARVNQEISLTGYGAMRNLGLVLACAMGFDSVVFVDDDEIIDDPEFLRKAMYGLGKLTKNGIPILAKTGYYINDQGSYLSKWKDKWYNRFWQQGRAFNEWMSKAIKGSRLSRSNHVCGGCLAIHKEAFRRLAFDAWIPRGEDLDYMLDLRMFGSDIWFDNKWQVRHLPPPSQHEGRRFRQDIFRWLYEYFKLEYSHSLIDLQKITASSLEPYPGPFLKKGLRRRIMITGFLRSLVRPDKKAYRRAAKDATGEAVKYGENNCTNYFEFQHIWPQIMDRIDSDKILTAALVQSALIEPMNRRSYASNQAGAAGRAADVHHAQDFADKITDASALSAGIDPGMTSQIRLDLDD